MKPELIKKSDIDSLLSFERVKAEIEKIETIDIAKAYRDRAEILRIYAKKIGKGLETQNRCAEIKIRAERRAGELSKKIKREQGKRTDLTLVHDVSKLDQLLKKIKKSRADIRRWELIAYILKKLFDQFLLKEQGKNRELTSLRTIKFAKKLKRDAYYKDIEEKGKRIILPKGILPIEGDFREVLKSEPNNSIDLIFTDPPYDENTIKVFGDLAKIANRILKPKGSLLTYVGHYAIPEVLNLMIPHLKFWWILAIKHTGPSARLPGKWIFVEWKPMLWFVKDGRRDNRYVADLFESKKPAKELHVWEQDLSEAEYYIKQLTNPGDLVLDPFCGLATTLIAAHKNNRRVLGVEKDNKTLLRAKVRISEYLKEKGKNDKT